MSQPLIAIPKKIAILFAIFVVLYEFSTYIANDMIMPGMLQVIKEFNAPVSSVASSLTAYLLGGASLQLFIGPLSDRFGRRPVMLIGVVLFLLFTLLLVCSTSIEAFIVARYFQGMGLCFTFVIGYAAIQEIFEEMEAVRLISLMANVSLIAPLLGPLLGAIVILYCNWRMIFILIGVLAFTALIGLWKTMPETIGATLSDGSVIPRVSLHPKIIWHNYRALLTNKSFMIGAVAMGFAWLPLLAWIAESPVILVNYAHLSILEYGLCQIPIFISVISGNFIMRAWTHRYSLKQIVSWGSLILLVALMLMAIVSLYNPGYITLVSGLSLYGVGVGIIGGPISRLVLFSTKVSKGAASAFMSILSTIVMALGIEWVSAVYKAHNNTNFAIYCAAAGMLYFMLTCLIKGHWQNKNI
ncbi:MAG: MFS transporter [Gammaproteobacteria bacterium]|nr:MFS transporter [Gammaproteobacteria bacterium]